MLRLKSFASYLLFSAVMLGIQSCGLEDPGFDNSQGSSNNSTNNGNSNSGDTSNSGSNGSSGSNSGSNDSSGSNSGSGDSSGSGSSATNANIEAGKVLYQNQCQACHMADGSGGVLSQNVKLTKETCTVCGTFSELVNDIKATMPTTSPASCGQDCSEKVGEYIWVTFMGQTPVSSNSSSGNDSNGGDNSSGSDSGSSSGGSNDSGNSSGGNSDNGNSSGGNTDNGNSSGSNGDTGNSGNSTSGVIFSETFENYTIDTQPTNWTSLISYQTNTGNSKDTGTYALVDTSQAYRGDKAMHFKGEFAQIVRELPQGLDRLYIRAFVRMNKQMGQVEGDNHEHIMGIKKTLDANNEIRVGQIKGALGTNEVPSDDIAPKSDSWWEKAPHKLDKNQWYCIETGFFGDTDYDQLYMWVDGTLVHSVKDGSEWNNSQLSSNSDWLSDKFNFVMFGFQSFSGNSAEVWMDDIVVSTEAIGCNPISADNSSGDGSGSDNGNGSGDNGSSNGDGAGSGATDEQIASGKVLFNARCAGCHGLDGQSTDKSNDKVIDPSKSVYGSKNESLESYIHGTMNVYAKTFSTEGCVDGCAANVAAYIKSWLDNGNNSGSGSDSGSDNGSGSGGDSADAGSCGAVTYGPRTIRILTQHEFSNSIEDLTGVNIASDIGSSTYDSIPADNLLDGFSNNVMASINSGALQSYDLVVNKVVDKLAEKDFESIINCGAYSDANSCSNAFITDFMPKVFRRPLTDSEKTVYQNMFTTEYTAGDINEGFKLAVRSMFTSPQFLYRDETGVSVAEIKSGTSNSESSSSETLVLIDSSAPMKLMDYAYESFNNKSLNGDEVIEVIARSTGTNASPVLRVNLNNSSEVNINIDSTDFKTYQMSANEVSGSGLHIGLQVNSSGSIEINSFKFVPASSLNNTPTTDVELDDDAYVLTSYQLASYLAFTFTGSTPDDALLAAAANGELETNEQIEAQVARLLKTDRAYEHFGNFAAEWMRTDGVLTISKSETVFPNFTNDVRKAMAQEVRDLFNHVVLDEKESFTSLYNGNYTFANQALAEFYGISGVTGDAMQKVTANNRAGLVTSGAFMTFHAHEEDTGPILRATYVRRRMLCQYVPAPPTGVSLTGDGEVNFDEEREAALQKLNDYLAAHGKATARLKYETQTSAGVCQTCHAEMINPLGFGMEDFDAVGLPQTKDFNGLSVDSSGALIGVTSTGDGVNIPFNGAVALANEIADLDVTRQCFVENTFRMAMGTGSTYLDRLVDVSLSAEEKQNYTCQVKKLDQRMVEKNESPLELLKALGSMDSVRYRKNVQR